MTNWVTFIVSGKFKLTGFEVWGVLNVSYVSYTLLVPDDADWITREILYIYFNKLY